jgi:transposase
MKVKSKVILGQWIENRLFLSKEQKRIIIEDYLSGKETKQAVYERHTGYTSEHGKISKWMKQLGIMDKSQKSGNFVFMAKQKKEKGQNDEDFDILKLKKRVAELEKQLQVAEMKAIAFSTMVDIAEKEFNIPIRKKHNTKL